VFFILVIIFLLSVIVVSLVLNWLMQFQYRKRFDPVITENEVIKYNSVKKSFVEVTESGWQSLGRVWWDRCNKQSLPLGIDNLEELKVSFFCICT